MGRWNESYPPQVVGSGAPLTISDHKPGSVIAKVLTEIQQRVANEYRGQGDEYISCRVQVVNNTLTVTVTLENPPVSLPSGGLPGQVLTRTSGDLDAGDGAQWDWVRAVDI